MSALAAPQRASPAGLEAVKQNGLAFPHAAAELRADREFVLAAVKQNGLALACAAEELKAEHELVLEAVEQDGAADFWGVRGFIAGSVERAKGDGGDEEYVGEILLDGFVDEGCGPTAAIGRKAPLGELSLEILSMRGVTPEGKRHRARPAVLLLSLIHI